MVDDVLRMRATVVSEQALAELSGHISDAQMRKMNEQVDIEHRSAAEVAREFLETMP